MIETDLQSLTLQELIYIAKKEGLEVDQTLTRTEIIEEILEYYDDNSIQLKENKNFIGDDRRFISSLVSVKGKIDIKNVSYAYGPKTSVHFLLESPNWAFIYWNISNRDLMKIGEENIDYLILHCLVTYDNEESESFDIEVDVKDTNRSLSFRRGETKFSIELKAKLKDQSIISLCQSQEFEMPCSWYSKNTDYLIDNDKDCKLAVSSLVTKAGNVIDNNEVKKILKLVEEGCHA